MLCSINPLCYLASCRIAAYFYWSKAIAFLMHRISLHIHRRRTHRTRAKSTPNPSLCILRGGTLKLRIISWYFFPSKTNGKRCQSSYAGAFVVVRFVHRWECVTIPHDDILRDAGHKQEHCWTKATCLTYDSMKQSWTQARLISTPLSPALNPLGV